MTFSGLLSGPQRDFVTELSFTLPNLASVDSVMAVTSDPVSSLNNMGFPLISMLTVQQESFPDTMALR